MSYFTLVRKWTIRFFLVGLLLFSVGIRSAGALDALETFDGSLSNPLLWEFTRNSGASYQSELSRMYINMAGFSPTTFPYLRSVDLSLHDVTKLELESRFSNFSVQQGAGIILSDTLPTEDAVANFNSYLFYIWPKPNGTFHLFTQLCSIANPGCNSLQQLVNGVVALPIDGGWHEYTLEYSSGRYLFFVDDILTFETVASSRRVNYVSLGQPEVTGSTTWPTFDVNYVSINPVMPNPSPGGSPIPSGSPVGSPAPSVSPGPSGSPVPSVAPSAFPYYSQSDSQWGSQLYDHANKWAEVGKRGIDRWGCALTSAAMVLKQHGVKTLAGLEVTPAALNAWLKGQEDGYIHNGLVNWLALTRYVRQSYNGGQSPTKLEFVKAPYGEGDVSAKLGAGLFPILGEPGHFVASRGEDDTSWQIHDPDDVSRTTLAKSSTLVSSNTFVPSLTDLSYMLFVYDTDMTLTVATAGGTVAGVVTEEYLADDVGGSPAPPVKLHYIAKPPSGMYNLEVTGQGRLDMYLYDEKGSNWTKKLNVKGDGDQIEFRFNRTHVNKTKLEYHYRRMWHYMHKWKRWIWFWHRGRWNDHWWD